MRFSGAEGITNTDKAEKHDFSRLLESGGLHEMQQDMHTYKGDNGTSKLDRVYCNLHPGWSGSSDCRYDLHLQYVTFIL